MPTPPPGKKGALSKLENDSIAVATKKNNCTKAPFKPEIVTRKSIPHLNCFNTARYTHLVQLTITMLCLGSLSVCIIAL